MQATCTCTAEAAAATTCVLKAGMKGSKRQKYSCDAQNILLIACSQQYTLYVIERTLYDKAHFLGQCFIRTPWAETSSHPSSRHCTYYATEANQTKSIIAFHSYSMLQYLFQAVFCCHVPLNDAVQANCEGVGPCWTSLTAPLVVICGLIHTFNALTTVLMS